MKVIIAGSRNIETMYFVIEAVKQSGFEITEVVSGNAKGVDKLGEIWAFKNDIPCLLFPAQWDKYGRKAGPLRNEEMGDYADALIAIWDGKSKGTKHMIDYATKKGLKVFVYESSN